MPAWRTAAHPSIDPQSVRFVNRQYLGIEGHILRGEDIQELDPTSTLPGWMQTQGCIASRFHPGLF
ncbi:hypothetical protein DSM3645_15420 [Blastopirellula marina DSM 3645]|uniref:Uncharacterized protein n=1 Tax=Blastopirellula marina DSM 3645 TaxID=314230 RepID=A3ZZ84_9BACT|nr:hypothetical protein DSM3645_15420 [Blastopirellula marina DSM 3645]